MVLVFVNIADSSASVAEDTTLLMMEDSMWIGHWCVCGEFGTGKDK